MSKETKLKLVLDASTTARSSVERSDTSGSRLLDEILDQGVMLGDAGELIARLPRQSVDLFFTSPPYADARAYSRVHPDRYVYWFLPFARVIHRRGLAS